MHWSSFSASRGLESAPEAEVGDVGDDNGRNDVVKGIDGDAVGLWSFTVVASTANLLFPFSDQQYDRFTTASRNSVKASVAGCRSRKSGSQGRTDDCYPKR